MKNGDLYFTQEELENLQKAPFAQVIFVVKKLIPFFENDTSDSDWYGELKDTYDKLAAIVLKEELWLDADGTKCLLNVFKKLPQQNRKTVMLSLGAFLKILSKELEIETGDKLKETEALYKCISKTHKILVDNTESLQ